MNNLFAVIFSFGFLSFAAQADSAKPGFYDGRGCEVSVERAEDGKTTYKILSGSVVKAELELSPAFEVAGRTFDKGMANHYFAKDDESIILAFGQNDGELKRVTIRKKGRRASCKKLQFSK